MHPSSLSSSLLLLAALVCTLATPSSQAAITLNDGGVTKLEVVARDRTGNPSLTNTFGNYFPASLPFDNSHVAIQGGSQSQATYHLGQGGFTISSTGTRAGSLDSRANVQPVIYFSVSVDTPYNISGSLSVNDPGLTGKYAELTTALTDLTASAVLLTNHQASFGVVDQSFALGGTAGNVANAFSGSLTGVLLAGHQYRLYYATSIYAANSGDPAAFVGTLDLSFNTITLNRGGVTKLEVVSRDRTGNPSLTNTISDLFPTSLPFDDSQVAIQGASQSQATYHLGQAGFTIRSSGARAGSLDSRANVQPVIFFSVSVDTPYSISGSLSVDDSGLTGKYVELTTTLTDLTTSGILFTNYQASFGVVDQSFALGGTAGNVANALSGSSTGVFLAGHQYRLFYGTSIYAANSGDPASFVGTFNLDSHALAIQMYAGLTITGVPGASYQIQYATNLNSPTNWITLTNLTLPNSPYLFFDATSASRPASFYRASLIP